MENGLDTINWDTYEQITGRDELPKVIKGIKQAILSGIHVKANVVLQKDIYEKEWKDLADLTRENPLDVRFIEVRLVLSSNKQRLGILIK